jgi:prolipoprotein diacylglyceryltransferase
MKKIMNSMPFHTINDKTMNIPRLYINIAEQLWPAYQVCGYTGLALALLVTVVLAVKLNLSTWILLGISGGGIVTFLSLGMVTKIIIGRESLIYYHHEIAILLVTADFIKFFHQPVMPYLDITLLGIGTFLFCGRIGCLMVGCCHGKPHGWGVCYTEEHREAGFTPHLVGVRLFPVQLLESLFVLFVVIVGTAMVLGTSYRPGEALTWYVIVYGAARFFFEFLRGDPDRPYFSGFSEAQWTSVILMSLVALGECSGSLPFSPWHAGVVILIVVVMAVLYLKRKLNKAEAYNILLARHIREVAGAVDAAATCTYAEPHISVGRTSLGYRISAGRIETPAGGIHHYAFSKEHDAISRQAAQALAELTLKLKHPGSPGEVVAGNEGVFHLLVSA